MKEELIKKFKLSVFNVTEGAGVELQKLREFVASDKTKKNILVCGDENQVRRMYNALIAGQFRAVSYGKGTKARLKEEKFHILRYMGKDVIFEFTDMQHSNHLGMHGSIKQ